MPKPGFVVRVPACGPIVKEPFDCEHSYQQLSDAVGGYIELAIIPKIETSGSFAVDCFVNEEGFLLGLPLNPRLTSFAREVYRGSLVGDAIFVGHNGEGETVGLDEMTANRIVSLLSS